MNSLKPLVLATALTVSSFAASAASNPGDRVYTADQNTNTVSVIDPNTNTLLGQINEQRRSYTLADAQAIRTPTLLIGGGATTGSLSVMWRVLAAHIAGSRTAVIPDAGHWMFEQAPLEYGEVVSRFLAD